MEDRGVSIFVYRVWMFGAGLIGFGLGVLLSTQVSVWLGAVILMMGIAIHGWGMFQVYKRK